MKFINTKKKVISFMLCAVMVISSFALNVSAEGEALDFTNQIAVSTDLYGGVYNTLGYKTNRRIDSAGMEEDYQGMCTTGYIPWKTGDVIRLANVVPTGSKTPYVALYDANKKFQYVYEFNEYFSLVTQNVYKGTFGAGSSTAYVRFSIGYIDEKSAITVNEAVSANEDMDVTIKKVLESWGIESVADYVEPEAERVAKIILEKMNDECLVGAFVSDIHYDINKEYTKTAVKNAADGIEAVRKLVPIDFFANLGDNGEKKSDFTAVHKAFYNSTLGLDGYYLRGNHDGSAYNAGYGEGYEDFVTDDNVYNYLGAHNKNHVVNPDDRRGTYGYKDYDDLRLRMIYVNTTDLYDNDYLNQKANVYVSPTQVEWIKNKALDFTEKDNPTAWKVLVISHAPLDWNSSTKQILTLLDEYQKQGGAKVIGNIHGHIHNCNTNFIGESRMGRFAIPQLCAGRYNEDSSYEGMAKWSDFAPDGQTPIYYYKGKNDATDTQFCFVVIDLKNEKFYAINYGVTKAVTDDGSYQTKVELREIPFVG